MSNSDNIDNQEAVKLEACPFCGSDEVDVIEFSAHGPAYVNCEGCGMQTPNASTFEEALAAWNTRTPAKLDAPDNQEALAGEGVEVGQRLFLAIAHGDEEHRTWLQEAITAFFRGAEVPPPRGDGRKVARIAELEAQLAAATLPSNEALAGDDRNGVEGIDGRRLMELANEVVRAATNLCEDTDQTGTTSASSGDTIVYAVPIESSNSLNAALDALTEALPSNEQPVPARALELVQDALSRTPSSPQADVADVERAELERLFLIERATVICDTLEEDARREPYRPSMVDAAGAMRELLATMTTRPAGVEEVERLVKRIEDTLRVRFDLSDHPASSVEETARYLAALTKPAALPKEGEEEWQALMPIVGREVDRRTENLMAAILPLYEYYQLNDCAGRDGNLEIPISDLQALVEAVDTLDSDAVARAALSSLPVSGEVAGKGIPTGIYYSREHSNFYSAKGRHGQGMEFWREWKDRRHEFPATAEAALTPQQATEEGV